MNCEETRQELDSYALGALGRKDAKRIDSHLKSCPECRALSRRSEESAGLLGLSVPLRRASASLRARLLDRVAPRTVKEPAFRGLLPAWGVRALAFAAPALAVAVVGIFVWAVALQNQLNDLNGENDLLAQDLAKGEQSIAQVRQELARAVDSQDSLYGLLDEQRRLAAAVMDPQAEAVELTSRPELGQIRGRYLWSPEYETGVFLASNLPVLPLELTYQLWVVEDGGAKPVGTFRPLSDGTARLVIEDFGEAVPLERLVVTVEPPGGSETQTGFSVLEGGVTH